MMPSPFGEDSELCRMLRLVAPQFEYRLFLSATPHNGHTRSFTGLLEMLDPVRFTRTSEMTAAMRGRVEDVVVRRLKREINARSLQPRSANGGQSHDRDAEPRFCTRHWRTRVVRIDLMSDLHVEGWAGQWTPGSGEQQAAWSAFRPDGPPADVAVIVGDCANRVERSAAVIFEAATHWPEVVVVDGNHEYYDTAEGDRPLDAAYKIWRRALAVAPNVHMVAPGEGWWDEEHNVQFLGANGWYDLEAGPQDRDRQWMLWWRKSVDMRRIDFGGHWPRERAKAEAEALARDVAWATSEPQVGAIVVVTHTQPNRAVLGEYADPHHPDAPHNGA